MARFRLYILFILLSAIKAVGLDISLGSAYNFNLPGVVTISREHADNIEFDAKFITKGLGSPQYYSIRFRENLDIKLVVNKKNITWEPQQHQENHRG